MEAVDIIKNLNDCFRVDAYKSASPQEDIEALENFSDLTIPEDYLGIGRVMTEVEILVNEKSYIRIWGAARCVEMNDAYQIQKYIPNSLAIGDDEGGMALIVMAGPRGMGIYTVGFGDLDANDAKFIAPSLSKFLIGGEGIEAI